MILRPLYDRIVVERAPAEERTKGGIYVPDAAQKKAREGTVRAVGPGRPLENGCLWPLEVKEGDRVLFGEYSGTQVTVDEQEYVILRGDELLAVLG